MHYSEPTYRPPYEADSLLLQVTTGCSHNACTFCSMYRDVPFRISPLDEVEEDIMSVARYNTVYDRVFLVNGDAFCLETDQLMRIAELIHTHLPRIRTIGGYASVRNVLAKSEGELHPELVKDED